MFDQNMTFANRIIKKSGSPIHLIWFITDRCNLRCAHCFYHRQISAESHDLNVDEIRKVIFHLPLLLSVSLTGGEPFLRNDLADIAGLLFKKTKNIVLFSNGYNTDTIVSTIEKILIDSPAGNLFAGISIDGFEEIHDTYRSKKGAYQKALETLGRLKKLKEKHRNFDVGVGITLHRANQDTIIELRDDIYTRFGINAGITLIRGAARCPELKDVDGAIYEKTIRAIEKEKKNIPYTSFRQVIIAMREVLGQKLAYNTFLEHSRSYDCYGGSLMAVAYANGDVHPCEMLEDSCMGNLRSYGYDINRIWQTTNAQKIRALIREKKCLCTYECQYTCNTLFNIRFAPVFMRAIATFIVRRCFNREER